MSTVEMLKKEVEVGAAWMDENRPGWHKRMNIQELDMSKGDRCILGQEYQSFLGSMREILPGMDADVQNIWAERHGFLSNDADAIQRFWEYRILTDIWIEVINARRLADEMEVITSLEVLTPA